MSSQMNANIATIISSSTAHKPYRIILTNCVMLTLHVKINLIWYIRFKTILGKLDKDIINTSNNAQATLNHTCLNVAI